MTNKTTMLNEILKSIKDEVCKTKVTATHKMTEPQKKLWKAYIALAQNADMMKTTANTAKKKFWNKMESDLNDFDNQLHVNTESWEIEVHEEDCGDCEHSK